MSENTKITEKMDNTNNTEKTVETNKKGNETTNKKGNETTNKKKEPDTFFIVPYRDRQQHLELFCNHMERILEDINYEILVIHQCDTRYFNRGAMKNIGFRFIKDKYPNTYKNKTLVFHDVDHVVWGKNVFDWKTTEGKIVHNYGFPRKIAASLGGIFTIKANDFEKTNGFPNYWAWGYEDNALYWRAKKLNFNISHPLRTLRDKDIILFWHGQTRLTNEAYIWKNFNNDDNIGLKEISDLKYTTKNKRENILIVNINSFNVPGTYPKLKNKIPEKSFHNADRKENYKNLFIGRMFS